MVPRAADPRGADALQQRLIAAGLFGELDEPRWAGHPYLPKAEFIPGGRELARQASMGAMFARAQPAVEERLRAAGAADYWSLVEAKMREAEMNGIPAAKAAGERRLGSHTVARAL